MKILAAAFLAPGGINCPTRMGKLHQFFLPITFLTLSCPIYFYDAEFSSTASLLGGKKNSRGFFTK